MLTTALTVFVALGVFTGTRDTGQTKAAESTVSSKEIIERFWSAAREQVKLENKFKPCPDARRAIVFYRVKTWEHQYFLGEALLPTNYPERVKGKCGYKKWRAGQWQKVAKENRLQLDRFKQTPYGLARFIVYSTFPKATASAALSVVGCESRYDESAHNTSTDVRGYFQVDKQNEGRSFTYRSKTLTIVGSRLFDPWYNTEVALFMTGGGYDWDEWHCQPFVGVN